MSIMAGISEECAYRGVAYSLLRSMGIPSAYALGWCATAFAICHLYQGWRAAARIGILGLASHAAVFLTGSLYLSIAVHATYDILVGWFAMQCLTAETVTHSRAEAEIRG
jgi:membrane protease YdiL (CAAX protease family)